ncbi:hypothetical protein ACS0TY_012964 [Phlomoides rotata]
MSGTVNLPEKSRSHPGDNLADDHNAKETAQTPTPHKVARCLFHMEKFKTPEMIKEAIDQLTRERARQLREGQDPLVNPTRELATQARKGKRKWVSRVSTTPARITTTNLESTVINPRGMPTIPSLELSGVKSGPKLVANQDDYESVSYTRTSAYRSQDDRHTRAPAKSRLGPITQEEEPARDPLLVAMQKKINDIKDCLRDRLYWGEIPLTITGLTKLQTLHLFSNNLTGAIPHAVGDLAFQEILILKPRLANVSFSYNSFSGELPPGLCGGFALEYFITIKNRFSRLLPECLKKCSRLRRVRQEDNHFFGNISEAFGVHEQLVISLSNNKFSSLTPKWGKFEQLTSVQMGHNRTTGVLPTELGDLTELRIMALDSNELTGGVPNNLGKLLRLNLNNNRLRGGIPPTVGQLTRLHDLDLSGNKLSGNIPQILGNCKNLKTLYLRNNFFVGNIPFELGELTRDIPSSLGKLVQLEILNLSHNSFLGKIPLQLSGMISLTSVDFSYNNMSGPVPIGNIFRRAPGEAFAENAGLLI